MFTRLLNAALIATVVAFIPVMAAEKSNKDDMGMGKDMKAQTVCPLSGKAINKTYSADYDGKRVYFCCPKCKAAFEKDPEKVMKKLKAEHVKLEMVAKMQSACPLSGKDIDKTIFADYQGDRVYFCCPKCKAAFEKDPGKTIAKLKADGVTLEKTPKKESM